jgi:hypothetical protein
MVQALVNVYDRLTQAWLNHDRVGLDDAITDLRQQDPVVEGWFRDNQGDPMTTPTLTDAIDRLSGAVPAKPEWAGSVSVDSRDLETVTAALTTDGYGRAGDMVRVGSAAFEDEAQKRNASLAAIRSGTAWTGDDGDCSSPETQ